MDEDRFHASAGLSAGTGVGMVKVGLTFDPSPGAVAGEYLWARSIGDRYARLEDVPAYATFRCYGAIVMVRLSRGSWTHLLVFEEGKSQAETQARRKALRDRLRANGYWGKVVGPGLLVVGGPVTESYH